MSSWRRGHTAMRRCDAALQERRQRSVATRRRTAMRRCDAALQERRQRSVATRRRTAMRRCDAALQMRRQRSVATRRRTAMRRCDAALQERRQRSVATRRRTATRRCTAIHEIGVGTQSWSLRSIRRGAGLIPPCGLAHNNPIPARGPVVGMCSDHIGPLPGFPGSPGFITPTCHRQVVDQTETIARL